MLQGETMIDKILLSKGITKSSRREFLYPEITDIKQDESILRLLKIISEKTRIAVISFNNATSIVAAAMLCNALNKKGLTVSRSVSSCVREETIAQAAPDHVFLIGFLKPEEDQFSIPHTYIDKNIIDICCQLATCIFPENKDKYLRTASIGVFADDMPLTGNNRIYAKLFHKSVPYSNSKSIMSAISAAVHSKESKALYKHLSGDATEDEKTSIVATLNNYEAIIKGSTKHGNLVICKVPRKKDILPVTYGIINQYGKDKAILVYCTGTEITGYLYSPLDGVAKRVYSKQPEGVFVNQVINTPVLQKTVGVYEQPQCILVQSSELSCVDAEEFKALEPFGIGNPAPRVRIKNATITSVTINKDGGSCNIKINNSDISFYIGSKDFLGSIDRSQKVDITCAFKPYALSIVTEIRNSIPKSEIDMGDVLSMAESDAKSGENVSVTNQVSSFGVRTKPRPLEVLGLTNQKVAQFNKAGIFSVEDLLAYFPKKYYDFRTPIRANQIVTGDTFAIIGRVDIIRSSTAKTGLPMVTATCSDENGNKFTARWFGQAYIVKTLFEGTHYIFCGTGWNEGMGYPSVNVLFFDKNINSLMKLVPVYKKIKGMSNDFLVASINKAIEALPNTDYLESSIVSGFSLPDSPASVRMLHSPRSAVDILAGQKRQVFDSLFRFNFILKYNAMSGKGKNVFLCPDTSVRGRFEELFPYPLTADQSNTVTDIINQFNSSELPVTALVQGDVGCGKTIIAFISAAVIAKNGYQACILAPTEILAHQHYEEFSSYAEKLGLRIGYLSGSTKAKEKKVVTAAFASGDIDILVGTHAVFSKGVDAHNLGLVVVDEQHKFGVEQRNKLLAGKENQPHIITMSATPIPRTLAMSLLGENIKVYSIKQKPNGRKTTITQKFSSNDRMYEYIYSEIQKGHQAYIVCPIIDETEKLPGVMSTKESVAETVKYFKKHPDVSIANISGRMKKEDIATEIERFKNNEAQILISTSIVEVGVNIPNATVMAIMSSDRFGLAQAHQLRGRVGRSDAQSYCLLKPDNFDDPKANILCSCADGFEIATEDLKMRGAGDFIGTKQSGNNQNVMLMINEPELYKKISELNDDIMNDPARFALYEYLLEDAQN